MATTPKTTDTVTVNGVECVRKDSIPKTIPTKGEFVGIAILQRGWVVIGRLSLKDDIYTMRNAYVIRKWGTSKGLGELALNGKQSETVLDETGSFTFHVLTTVGVIPCIESKWSNIL